MYQVCSDIEWNIDKARVTCQQIAEKEELLDLLQNGKNTAVGKDIQL